MKNNFFLLFTQQIAKYLPLWTQGAGSNLSEKKDAQKMIIKASGFRLDQVNETQGSVELNFPTLKLYLQENLKKAPSEQETFYSQVLALSKSEQNSSTRPSMEAGFHALSPYKYVLHFHSLPAILMAEYPEWLKKKDIHIIPLVNPGWELSKFFIDNDAELNILMNHGVMLQSNSEDVLETWNQLEDSFLAEYNYSLLQALKNKITSTNQPLTSKDLAPFLKGPLKFYFPDMAIYYPKLKPFLKPIDNNQFELLNEANKDLVEIWTATQILYQSKPDLPELPEKMIEEITKLPTEQLRQNFIKG